MSIILAGQVCFDRDLKTVATGDDQHRIVQVRHGGSSRSLVVNRANYWSLDRLK